MTANVIISMMCLAAIAFLIRFLIALCKEGNAGACHVVRILPYSSESGVETDELPSTGVADGIPRQRRFHYLQQREDDQQRPLHGAHIAKGK